ncbi:MAG: alanine racemase [Pyrinomonadaceae bacterium]
MFKNISVRPTWTEISLKNLSYNFRSIKEFVGDSVKFAAIVKADAYGHGAIECARTLEREDIDWFGVALVKEGIELREAGIRKRILCLGGFWEGQQQLLLDYGLTPAIFSVEQAATFNFAAQARGTSAEIHIKIDTGMNRIGIRFDQIGEFLQCIKPFKNIHIEGVMSHFAAADDEDQREFTMLQAARFDKCVETFRAFGHNPVYLDLANTPASVGFRGEFGNMVRLGGFLYGLADDMLPANAEKPDYKPVLSLFTQIALIKHVPKGETIGYGRTFSTTRDSLIAAIPIGFHDGYPRILSNRAAVLINGKRAPIVGRISMDWTIIDVTDVGDVSVGDRVTIIGEDGSEKITAAELAQMAETISYEITCGINERVERKIL